MAYFQKDFIDFFKELAGNNNKQWFDANRKRYEKSVKDPFKAFVEEMIVRLKKEDPRIDMSAQQAIFRINRDIRFSKDKTPYKAQSSAMISVGGKKDHSTPGLYFQFDPEHVRIYSGCYELEKDALQGIREAIKSKGAEFKKLMNAKKFKDTFGEIHGDKNKILPKDLQAAAEKQPLIYNKSFYYYHKLPPKTVLDPNLPKILVEHFKIAQPLGAFFEKAMRR